jgi:hypothetical protein
LALRKEFPDPNPLACPTDQGDDAEIEDIKKLLGIDIPSEDAVASHSREGGNPSSCGPTWTPAYAGVTATDEDKK